MSDILDTRNLEKRIVELTDERVNYIKNNAPKKATKKVKRELGEEWDETTEGDELKALIELREELGSGWGHGITMIRSSHFEDYARELAEDIGAIKRDQEWPANCIDWTRAADELKQDYTLVTFQGDDYYCRE